MDAKQYHAIFRVSPNGLSQREQAVFALICEGKGPKEIGRQLSVSPKTIDTYRLRIAAKFGFETARDFRKFLMSRRAPSLATLSELAELLRIAADKAGYGSLVVLEKR